MSAMDDERRLAPPLSHAEGDGGVGHVTLVGAGPGDPELLTLRAARCLAEARLVLYDHLVSDAVLAHVNPSAECVDVGKVSGCHTLSQAAIIERMVFLARSGRSLVRLKGGDGYIFGRGGEEAEALAAAGVPFDVVPGLTAAQGAAASLGIPLTHRDHAGTLILVTGHGRDDHAPALNWRALAQPRQTLVIYMGLAMLPYLSAQLVAHGLSGHTPAALIERATRPDERCVIGTLASLPVMAREHRIVAPALIVVGNVVALQPVLHGALRKRGADNIHQLARHGLIGAERAADNE